MAEEQEADKDEAENNATYADYLMNEWMHPAAASSRARAQVLTALFCLSLL